MIFISFLFSYVNGIMSIMKHRDYVKRIVRTKNGIKYYILVERIILPDNTVHRVLPDTLLPYKHYEKEIIFGVLDGLITPDVLGFEDYPCEITMKRWISQIKQPLK